MSGPEHGSGRHRLHNPMTTMPKLPKPDQMTPAERNAEVAEIFARAILRIQFQDHAPADEPQGQNQQEEEMEPCQQN